MLIMRQVSKPITAVDFLTDVIVLPPSFEVIPEYPDLWMGSPRRVSPEQSHNEMRTAIQVKKEDVLALMVLDILFELLEKIEYHLKIPPKVF
jgi:hypothetical protein